NGPVLDQCSYDFSRSLPASIAWRHDSAAPFEGLSNTLVEVPAGLVVHRTRVKLLYNRCMKIQLGQEALRKLNQLVGESSITCRSDIDVGIEDVLLQAASSSGSRSMPLPAKPSSPETTSSRNTTRSSACSIVSVSVVVPTIFLARSIL